jgi:hypothetical protein
MPALACCFAMLARFGPWELGVPDFLIPALAEFQMDPKASPPEAAGFGAVLVGFPLIGAPEAAVEPGVWENGTGTEVK